MEAKVMLDTIWGGEYFWGVRARVQK